MIRHHFTVDVEEYFQVSALEGYVARARWDALESRVEPAVDRLLEMLAEAKAAGTFFTLGWIAERHPAMVRRIVDGGHELASHGWEHRRVTTLTPAEFRESVRRSKALLEDVAGVEVHGYREPSFSILRERFWAYDILLEEGYRYDSSLYPGRAGHAAGPRVPHGIERERGTLRQYPIATLAWRDRVWPAGGGAYLRLLPLRLVRSALQQAERSGVGATFYIHPWEIDAAQPRFATNLRTRMRHYGGLRRTEERLRRLLREFAFGSIEAPQAAELAG
jgi:polysaccharide deacetylase family protein (PEP-CTERM system associated)